MDIGIAARKSVLGMIASYLKNGSVDASSLPGLEWSDGLIRFTHTSATGITFNGVVADRTGETPVADGVSLYFLGDELPDFDTPLSVSTQPVLVKVSVESGAAEKDQAEIIAMELCAKVRAAVSAGYTPIQDYAQDPLSAFQDAESPSSDLVARWFGQEWLSFRKVVPEANALADMEAEFSMVVPA